MDCARGEHRFVDGPKAPIKPAAAGQRKAFAPDVPSFPVSFSRSWGKGPLIPDQKTASRPYLHKPAHVGKIRFIGRAAKRTCKNPKCSPKSTPGDPRLRRQAVLNGTDA